MSPHKDPVAAKEWRDKWRDENRDKRREQSARYRALHPEKFRESVRRSVMKSEYGITLEEYDEMCEAQGGVCACCGRTNGSRRLAVDHDHKTGRVRGLLCSSCNLTLGRLDENIDWLMALVRYLENN